MSCTPFPVIAGAVPLGTAAVDSTDAFRGGIRLNAGETLVRAIASGGDEYANGLLMTDSGQLRYVDATAGLPAGTVWGNGLPRSAGALCVSTDAVSTYSNGIPFVANGAVAVTVTA